MHSSLDSHRSLRPELAAVLAAERLLGISASFPHFSVQSVARLVRTEQAGYSKTSLFLHKHRWIMIKRSSLLALSLLLVPFVPARAQQFGGALAISGDHVLVGETGKQIFPGIVYVYNRVGGTWMEVSQMTASDNEGGPDGFGRALAAQGETLLVGAPGTATSAGTVYLLQRDGSGNWTESGRFVAGDAAEGDAFGSAVVISGDIALVSATGQNDGVGAVYVMRTRHERDMVATGQTHRRKCRGG